MRTQQQLRTQDIPKMKASEFYQLDPEYVSQPAGLIPMSRAVFVSLLALRIYLLGLLALVAYRFAQYAHWIKP